MTEWPLRLGLCAFNRSPCLTASVPLLRPPCHAWVSVPVSPPRDKRPPRRRASVPGSPHPKASVPNTNGLRAAEPPCPGLQAQKASVPIGLRANRGLRARMLRSFVPVWPPCLVAFEPSLPCSSTPKPASDPNGLLKWRPTAGNITHLRAFAHSRSPIP